MRNLLQNTKRKNRSKTTIRHLKLAERGGFGFLARFLLASKTRLAPLRRPASLRSASGVEAIVVCAVAHATTLAPFPPVGRRGLWFESPSLKGNGFSPFNKYQRPQNPTERGGFEPPEPSRIQRFSRPPDSTTLASLQKK